jgi:hypothetical protein
MMARHDREYGWIPLHHAIGEMSELNVLKYLVKKCPESIRTKTRDGEELPLHMELQTLIPNLKVIPFLVNAHKAALHERTAEGWLPLHLAVMPDEGHDRNFPLGIDVLRFLVQKEPLAVREAGPEGQLPIHCLLRCESRVDVTMVQLLGDRHPGALLTRDDEGCLPIHLISENMSIEEAITWMESSEILEYMVAKCPASVRERPPKGGGSLLHLALHVWPWACSSVFAIGLLVDACPDVLQLANDEGDLPIHMAVGKGDMSVVRYLLRRSPESIRARGRKGRVPVHIAADYESLGLTQGLLNLWPESTLERDEDGQRPLHRTVKGFPAELDPPQGPVPRGALSRSPCHRGQRGPAPPPRRRGRGK